MDDKTLVSFDFAIKYLLKDKSNYDVVEGFISTLIASCGYSPIKIKALLESASNKETPNHKSSIADMIVEDEQGTKYIVEIDRSYTSLFLHKACFNSSRLIVDSISSGEDYSSIKKIIHINLLYFPFSNTKTPLHYGKTVFHEIDTQHPQDLHIADLGMKFFDSHNVFPEYFVISVPLFNDVINNEMDEWLYVVKNSEVRPDFKSPYMKKVAERLNVLKMTPEEKKTYQAYRNESLKERDYIVSAEEKGREEGIEKGREEGVEKRTTEIAINMLKEKLDDSLIKSVTGLSQDDLDRLKNKL